ncbi:unnamed protein product [Rotaria sp. Silwood2]|nr:unnamed protein product [Rotaria sp. Silwood2]CAF4293991.1 unnamed protein product [Rotaria sp. Silwood2]
MNRRIRCGRLALTKDGVIKKLELEDGGGSRYCNWDPIDMDFDTVHRRLVDIFQLGESKLKTSLYDFQRHPLDINQYYTFFEYFNKNGLNCSSTIIYICTHQVYSFEKFSNDLVNNIRIFISQYGLDEISTQLFEYICIIQGYVCSVIHPLNQQLEHFIQNFQLHNQLEIELYSNILNKVCDICHLLEELIESNKRKFDYIEQFSIIVNLFYEFHENLKVFTCFK